MKVSDSRITFMGDSVAWDWSGRFARYIRNRDIQSIGFALAASEVALKIGCLSVGHNPSLLEAALIGGYIVAHNTMWIFGSRIFEHLELRKIFSADDIRNKCIDTQPDDTLPPNLEQWGLQAYRMRKNYKFGAIAMAAISILSGGVWLIGSAPIVVRQFQGLQRWKKVETGEWRIVDKGPPPEPVRQDERNLVSAAIRQIAPAL
jgi:hypothetical protein